MGVATTVQGMLVFFRRRTCEEGTKAFHGPYCVGDGGDGDGDGGDGDGGDGDGDGSGDGGGGGEMETE